MEFKNLNNGMFGLIVDDYLLEMTRVEAERLFVDIGHTLQDDDIQRYDENGETEDQP